MHSVAAGSFVRLSSVVALWRAWQETRRGKRRQPRLAAFDLDADTHLIRLQRALAADTWQPGGYRLAIVREPKTRLIAAPEIADRIVQRALLDEIGPGYERSFIDHSFACCRGRGPQRALLQYLAWTREHRFRLSLDVRRYFASIEHATLYRLFARRLDDRRTLSLIARLLAAGGAVYQSPLARSLPEFADEAVAPGRGMPLGGYLSHWSGALYLDGLDHFVKRSLKIGAYLRYMDDFTLFGDDPYALAEAQAAISEWLRNERKLELKPTAGAVQPTTQPSTFLGFRVSRAGLLPGPKARRRLRQRLRDASVLGPDRLTRGLRAYRGVLLTLG